ALVELNQWATCRHCDALLRSGEYDWVLAEITQECEWRMPTGRVPGVAELREVDPQFNLQAMEDRASVVFWRWAAAERVDDVAPLRKVAADAWCDREQARRETLRKSCNGQRRFIGQCAVGSVEVAGIIHAPGYHQALVEIRWSGKHFQQLHEHTPPRSTGADIVARTMFVMQREASVQTDVDQSLSSAHCPNCGGPESSSASDACDFCGTTLNRTQTGWVMVALHDW